jgi:hypothetical protein
MPVTSAPAPSAGPTPAASPEAGGSPEAAASPAMAPASDFHLVESADGWVLTVNVTDRLRAALTSANGNGAAARTADFTVHVEPNLLPGDPFPATLQLLQPSPRPRLARRPTP